MMTVDGRNQGGDLIAEVDQIGKSEGAGSATGGAGGYGTSGGAPPTRVLIKCWIPSITWHHVSTQPDDPTLLTIR